MLITLYDSLPGKLERNLLTMLEKAWNSGVKSVVWAESEEQMAHLDNALWTAIQSAFLPHATRHDENAQALPVVITDLPNNPNNATCLVNLRDTTLPDTALGFERCVFVQDQETTAVHTRDNLAAQARQWVVEGRHEVKSWRQNTSGGWDMAQH